MRPSPYLFLALALPALALAPSSAPAKNVLLPTEATSSPNTSATPNLGLSPTQSSQQSDSAPAASTPAPSSATPTSPIVTTPGAPPSANQRATAYELVKQTQEARQKALGTSYKKTLEDLAAKERAYQESRKPTFIEDRPDELPDARLIDDLKKTMTTSIEPSYLWGANDVERLHTVLALKPQEIASNCQLRFNARVTSDEQRGFRVTLYAGQQATLKYTGMAQTVEYDPFAVCNKLARELPNSGETIRVSGNRYVVPLMKTASCAVNGTATNVVMKYTGDGAASCVSR